MWDDLFHLTFLRRLLEWYWESVQKLIKVLNLDYTASRSLLAFDFGITLFCAFSLVAFLVHDVLESILGWLWGAQFNSHSFAVFLVSLVVLTVSLLGILLLELQVKRRQ